MTGSSVSVTGNITAAGGVFGSGNISTTGNISGGNFIGAIVGTSSSLSGNITANNGMFTTIVNTASFTGSLVSVTGNIISGGKLGFSGAGSFSGSGYEIARDGADFLAFSGGTAGIRFINSSSATEWARFDSTGNLSVAGSVIVNSAANATAIVNGAANATGNIGSTSVYFNRLFAQATTALYADLAEMYTTDAKYAPGTVLVFGGTQEVTTSTVTHDHRVAGVVSTNPAHIMNSGLQGEHTVEVALIGRVPVSVIGNISAGDRVVTSNRAGVAEALDITRYQPGVIIGKALQSHCGDEIGVIEVVVGRL